jgi:hypothetical protein
MRNQHAKKSRGGKARVGDSEKWIEKYVNTPASAPGIRRAPGFITAIQRLVRGLCRSRVLGYYGGRAVGRQGRQGEVDTEGR